MFMYIQIYIHINIYIHTHMNIYIFTYIYIHTYMYIYIFFTYIHIYTYMYIRMHKPELWCEGGEIRFIQRLAEQSRQASTQCLWFSSLVSRSDNLPRIHKTLENMRGIQDIKVIPMAQVCIYM